MALALPYPDMDFVPLDILLASELNQMVANIEYIGGSDVFPITTANITDGAVTAGKIDWTTLTPTTVNATIIATTKITSSTVTLVYNQSGFGVVTGAYRIVGDVTYGEELLRFPNITAASYGTSYGQLFNQDVGTPQGQSYIRISSNVNKTGLSGYNNINASVVLS